MATFLNIALTITIWLLVTADLSWPNVVIGVVISLLLSRLRSKRAVPWKTIVSLLWDVVLAIPKAYIEAFEMILWPHQQEEVTIMPSSTSRASEVVFLEIFLITFTPKTIVLDQREGGGYDVHQVVRR